MTNGNVKKGGGGGGRDMVLESRHLIGLFLGVVVLCGVFFTLGYVMGRTQYDTSVRAAGVAAKPSAAPAAPAKTSPVPAPSSWDFYRAAEPKKEEPRLEPPKSVAAEPAASRPAPAAAPTAAAGSTRTSQASRALRKPGALPPGAVVLQVAALTRENDALALAEALQQKQYSAFVLTPAGDNLYRVQVGPYADAKSADAAKRSLEREGFKAIVRR